MEVSRSKPSLTAVNPTLNAVRFTVVMPAFNAAAFIAEALDSVFSQTLPPAEVIVVNDGSTDETLQIVRRYGDRVRCISQENKGLPTARNIGIQNAENEWIALLDSDDRWRADKLERQTAVILENPAVDFVYTGMYTFFEDRLEELVPAPPASKIKNELMNWIPFAVSSVVFRRFKALEIGGFDPIMRLSEEWDMWLRMIEAGAEFAAVNEPLTFYRRSPLGLTHQAARLLEYQKIVVRNHIARDASIFDRWWKHSRLIGRLEGEAAIVMRETGSSDYLSCMMRSLIRHPFPLSATDKRFKVALHMLLSKVGVLRTHPGHSR